MNIKILFFPSFPVDVSAERLKIALAVLYKVLSLIIKIFDSAKLQGTQNSYRSTVGTLIRKQDTVYFTYKSGKIYIGVILKADTDHDETTQYMTIAPFYSGEKTVDGKVRYTTRYDDNIDAIRKVQGYPITFVIDGRELNYFGKFHEETHSRLIAEGAIEYAFESKKYIDAY
ncbi:MAG: hypothetical protein EOP04_22135 [Proteobacteria bacterium]|nr:MAG: hypothetical protein EOP04_22135 [Pseudomonadota bacterium]